MTLSLIQLDGASVLRSPNQTDGLMLGFLFPKPGPQEIAIPARRARESQSAFGTISRILNVGLP